MWFKDFNLDWFGTKKMKQQIEDLTKGFNELVEIVKKEKENAKPYKNGYYSNGILTVVLNNGDVISNQCTVENAKKLSGCTTEEEVKQLYDKTYYDKEPVVIADNKNVPKKELEAKKKFIENSDELLEILGKDFKKTGEEFFYKKVKLPIPTILLNAFVENKRVGNVEVYNSLVNFWLWTSLNPIQSSREDLFAFIRKNDVKLTPGGLLVLYRRIVSVNNDESVDKKLEGIISLEYFRTKKTDKKSPKNYSLVDIEGKYKRVPVGKEGDYKVIGNLHDLYVNMSAIPTNVYTDRHTGKMKIQIGSIYRIDEDKVDINSRNDCSAGLHVASKRYNYGSFGDTPVLCLVNPSKVRSVPVGECSKMRVSEMFIASKLDISNGKYMDDDLDIIPFEDEYSKITLEELEKASENGFEDVKPTKTEMPLSNKESEKIIVDIKKHLLGRIKTI